MHDTATFTVYNASAGSGKTFMLVYNYLKVLFQSPNPNRFQHILAVTFTNKAAAEMKDRVIDTLNAIALSKENKIKDLLEETLDISPEKLQKKAEDILSALIRNYSQFNIQTIDTFTHRLVRTFAIDLGLSANFEVELDIDSRINEAVEQVINQVGNDDQVTKVLLDYALQQTDEDRSWDLSRDLSNIGQIIFDEDSAEHLNRLQQKNISDFIAFKDELFTIKKSIEQQFSKIGSEGLKLIDDAVIPSNGFFRSLLPNFLRYIRDFNNYHDKIKFDGELERKMSEGVLYSKAKEQHIKDQIDTIASQLITLYNEAKNLYEAEAPRYFLSTHLLKSVSVSAVLNQLNTALNTIKDRENIQFLGAFNQIINRHLLEQPAAYIYERIGERFKHYFIDEMQDTSVLQWRNLIPLVENAVSQTRSGVLLVGDAKQSIYRWRGGKPEQFICLATKDFDPETCDREMYNPFSIEKEVKDLDKNYRSFSTIIDFNNRFFTGITKYLQKKSHAELYKNGNRQKFNSKIGGFVQLSFLEPGLKSEELDAVIPERVYEIIRNLEGKINPSDICILVRKRDQGELIASYLSEQGIAIESSESLLLKNDPNVQFILYLLRYLDNPEDQDSKFYWLQRLHTKMAPDTGKHSFINNLIGLSVKDTFEKLKSYRIDFDVSRFAQTPLYDNVEQIIRSFGLTEPANAYIQFFLEEVFKFTSKNTQSTSDFLEYWDLKEDTISLAGSDNAQAVKISTIHKAKGLQYRVVIFPFQFELYDVSKVHFWLDIKDLNTRQNFDSFYVKAQNILQKSGESALSRFNQAKDEAELDNLNLLYVAFTRAVEQLYIIAGQSASKKKKAPSEPEVKTTGDLLKNFLIDTGQWEDGKDTYTFGDAEPDKNLKPEPVETEIFAPERIISNPWQNNKITISPGASVLWGSDRKKAIDYGNLIHHIMEQVITADDLEPVFEELDAGGIVQPEDLKRIKEQLTRLVNHPDLSQFFKPGNRVLTERELIDVQKRIHKPDRINFTEPGHVVIIDYKTGQHEPKNISQVLTYAGILKDMGYTVDDALLVYIGENIHIKNCL